MIEIAIILASGIFLLIIGICEATLRFQKDRSKIIVTKRKIK